MCFYILIVERFENTSDFEHHQRSVVFVMSLTIKGKQYVIIELCLLSTKSEQFHFIHYQFINMKERCSIFEVSSAKLQLQLITTMSIIVDSFELFDYIEILCYSTVNVESEIHWPIDELE
ncbi:hypothetical protein T10_11278 [Trichinella papuae]|uniref:Uncharacterized protein n=1 Tax=Trichinella papuae TaxID=268474 RepID=A0A0V1MHF2_9BILA|nr:hypothetical protein T10_6365 [Trichinella papuae]KRZ71145.1 hypothetical protein T10_11278 [Trichinella papuae]